VREVVTVIPCYREPIDEVRKSLESALAVSDHVRIIHADTNGGPGAALDIGTRAAPEGSIICRLDVRDCFYPEAKLRQIETVRSGRCRASASYHFDPVTNSVHVPPPKWQTRIYTDSVFTQISTVYERSVWEEIGIDATLRWAEDWLFLLRVQHYIGWSLFPEVTCSAGMFAGGHTDRGGSSRDLDRVRVVEMGRILSHPDAYAHLYNEKWCRKRGITPLKRKP
jgi:hypothetical protein